LLTGRVDEWSVWHVTVSKRNELQSVDQGALGVGEFEDKADKEKAEKAAEDNKGLLERVKNALGEQVKESRVSTRLTDSPACLVVDDYEMSQNLARVLKQMGQDAPMPVPVIELNLEHPLLKRMDAEADEDKFNDLAQVIFDQALLAEGGQLEDPASFVHRLNRLLLELQ